MLVDGNVQKKPSHSWVLGINQPKTSVRQKEKCGVVLGADNLVEWFNQLGVGENNVIAQSIEGLIDQQGSDIVTGDGQPVSIEQSTHSFPELHLRPLKLIGHLSAFFLN